MCGRYNIISDAPAWVTAFGLPDSAVNEIAKISQNYNVAPTQHVPIVRTLEEIAGLLVPQKCVATS